MTYEQLEKCYNTVLKQRDEAESKVTLLTSLIDDDLYNEFNIVTQDLIREKMKNIGVISLN